MRPDRALSDIGIGLIGGYVGTRVMEPVTTKLYELESEEDRRREDAARPGPSYQIAAQKTAQALGLQLREPRLQQAGLAFHYGLGISWGPVYTLVRRLTGLHPLVAGLLTGTAMWALVDEGMTPALGFSAPNRAYPVATHLRGFLGHLAFGLGAAAAAELLYWLGRHAGRGR